VTLTASILRIYVSWQVTNVKLPYNDIEMSKYVGVYYTYIYIYVYIYKILLLCTLL